MCGIRYSGNKRSAQCDSLNLSSARPATPEDLQLQVPAETLPYTLIMDGIVQYKNFAKANVTEEWLKNELERLILPI
jgi:uncharacterized membrane protein YcaP (DUF421 family)